MCFKPRFPLFHLLQDYEILWKYSFFIGYSDILNKLETIVYYLLLRGHRAILSYLGLKFPQIQSRKGNSFIPYSKVIGLTNYK